MESAIWDLQSHNALRPRRVRLIASEKGKPALNSAPLVPESPLIGLEEIRHLGYVKLYHPMLGRVAEVYGWQ